MPALTISTNHAHRSRSSSPKAPPISPLTPTLGPTRFDEGRSQRQTYAHSQPDQTAILPPPPEPIAFDANPDVIAMKSAISVLQIQRKRATEDIQTLSRARDEAVEEPEAFMKDLLAGRTQQGTHARGYSDHSDDDDGEGQDSTKLPQRDQTRAWNSLPKPQNVVRSPPINWAQYAVVGESLDKLHKEQVEWPTQGTPAIIGPNGTYDFKGGDGKQEKYAGVAQPYLPGNDKVDRRASGGKK